MMAEEELQNIIETSRKLYENRDFQTVIQLYREYLARHESDLSGRNLARIYNDIGHAKYMLVQFDSAVEDYNEALKHDPGFAAARYNKATVVYRMGRFTTALTDFRLACEIDAENEEFKLGLQTCLRAINE